MLSTIVGLPHPSLTQGLQFMHEEHTAHRCVLVMSTLPPNALPHANSDCMLLNIMYDPKPMYPNLFHPASTLRSPDYKSIARHTTRTASPVKYYFIDFGLSRRYNPDDGPPREHPILGGDKSVPEFRNWGGTLPDPFPTDIYYLGSMMRTWIMGVSYSKLIRVRA